MTRLAFLVFLASAWFLGACDSEQHSDAKNIRLATTTSVRDSGLLAMLLPIFEDETGCRVDVLAVGTGAALSLGQRGDADAVLVHARDAELDFIAAGYGTRREVFMENFFVLLGPLSDPAGLRGQPPARAFTLLATTNAVFVSRGDDSGTHKKEIALRQLAGLTSPWGNVIESGQGMGATLTMADQLDAYVLCDAATALHHRVAIRIVSMLDEDESLRNPYSIIPVAENSRSQPQATLTESLVDFMTAARTQALIAGFKVDGRKLFTPTRLAAKRRGQ